jgi:hypothetical protein
MSGAIPPLPHYPQYAFMAWFSGRKSTDPTLHFYFTFTFIIIIIITLLILFSLLSVRRLLGATSLVFSRQHKEVNE